MVAWVDVPYDVKREGEWVELDVRAVIAGSLDIYDIIDVEKGATWIGELTDREYTEVRNKVIDKAYERRD